MHRAYCVDRRAMMRGGAALALALGMGTRAAGQPVPGAVGAPPPVPEPHSFETVIALARDSAARGAEAPPDTLSGPFVGLNLAQYRAIQPRAEAQVWGGQGRGFTLEPLPPGFHFEAQVRLDTVAGGTAQKLDFRLDRFRFDPAQFDPATPLPPVDPEPEMGYAGFRLRHGLNRPDLLDEFLVFQGASYFRAIARHQYYGLSARGLAIATGAPQGEEFPYFTRFWVIEPEPNATSVEIHALLDSPSCAGAYRFVVRPGDATVMEVQLALFPRVEIADIGLAPLTSMFYFNASRRAGIDDYRNAVHDSSGLQMLTGRAERIWRPLANPGQLQVSAFADTDPKGFGLIQRQRSFDDYLDTAARYDRRPSAWVEPLGGWGAGAVVLVEIPTPNEFNDNIVAFWRPRAPLAAGVRFDLEYRLHWAGLSPDAAPIARVAATRSGLGPGGETRAFVVDFDLDGTAFDGLGVDLWTSAGRIETPTLTRLPGGMRARVAFGFAPEGSDSAELGLGLRGADGVRVSETWLYRWTAV